MGVTTGTAAVVAGAAAALGYAAGVLGSRGGKDSVAEAPRMKAYRGAMVEVVEKPQTEFSIDSGVAKKGAVLFKAKCAACHSCVEGGGADGSGVV